MQPKYTPKEIERFWGKVKKSNNPSECWLWIGRRNPRNYGLMDMGGRDRRVHRVMYELVHGEFPEELFVLHECDNPPCVNPNHLFLGTHQDNMDDRGRKGRQARGERDGNHKLTDAQVAEIRQKYIRGKVSQKSLANIYKVHVSQISHIVLYKQRT